MRRGHWIASSLAVLLMLLSSGSAMAAEPTSATFTSLRNAGAAEVRGVWTYAGRNAGAREPQRIVLALHGMGGNGQDFGSALASQADARNWLIVAPTIAYGEWTNASQLAREEPALIAWLSDYVAKLAQRTNRLAPSVLVLGHSRGAQLAVRFAELHPEQVLAVAALSAGTYTLPLERDPLTRQAINFPFGLNAIARADGGIPFNAARFNRLPIWIGVGSDDANPQDVPRAFDPYIGTTRLDRARSFTRIVNAAGGSATLTVFPGAPHGLSEEMRTAACSALASSLNRPPAPSAQRGIPY